MEFTPSDPLGIGMEMEFQLIDRQSLDLVDGIVPLMELFPNSPYVKPEFIQNTVEIASKVCYSLEELESHVTELVATLRVKANSLGMELCGAGTHPFGQRLAVITPSPNYLRMEKKVGYLSHTQITFATHVHIGMSCGEETISVMRDLQVFLPLLIGLSASSPFWRGYDTGFASYRHRILAADRSFGIPPTFANWEAFRQFFNTAQRAGVFETMHNIHWDIRPRPHLGTLEVRVMDAQPSVAEAVALAGFVRALVTYLKQTPRAERPQQLPAPLPWWIEKDNHYQASRLGLGAKFIFDERGTVRRLGDIFNEVVDVLGETAESLGQGAHLQALRRNVEAGVSYIRQRQVYSQTNSLKAVVAAVAAELSH